MRGRPNYEADEKEFPAEAYVVAGKAWRGVAVYVLGWETRPDEDTEWSGFEQRTGKVLVIMVGDDARHAIDRDDLTPLDDGAYCHGCGQIGCTHDGRERAE